MEEKKIRFLIGIISFTIGWIISTIISIIVVKKMQKDIDKK